MYAMPPDDSDNVDRDALHAVRSPWAAHHAYVLTWQIIQSQCRSNSMPSLSQSMGNILAHAACNSPAVPSMMTKAAAGRPCSCYCAPWSRLWPCIYQLVCILHPIVIQVKLAVLGCELIICLHCTPLLVLKLQAQAKAQAGTSSELGASTSASRRKHCSDAHHSIPALPNNDMELRTHHSHGRRPASNQCNFCELCNELTI